MFSFELSLFAWTSGFFPVFFIYKLIAKFLSLLPLCLEGECKWRELKRLHCLSEDFIRDCRLTQEARFCRLVPVTSSVK